MKKIIFGLATIIITVLAIAPIDKVSALSHSFGVSFLNMPAAQTVTAGSQNVTVGVYNINTRENISIKKLVVRLEGTYTPIAGTLQLVNANNEVVAESYPLNGYVLFQMNDLNLKANTSTPIIFKTNIDSPQSVGKNLKMTIRSIEAINNDSGNKVTGYINSTKLFSNLISIVSSEFLQINKLASSNQLVNGTMVEVLRFSVTAHGADAVVKEVTASVYSSSTVYFNNMVLKDYETNYSFFPSMGTSTTGNLYQIFNDNFIIPAGSTKIFSVQTQISGADYNEYAIAKLIDIKAVNAETEEILLVKNIPQTNILTK